MTPPRRRSDAEQNRARILDAAREYVVTSNDLKLNEIAKAAGVGQGTLYRHFPTREALLAEVYQADVEALVTAAPDLLAEYPPVEALARWLNRVADYAKVKRGVFAAVTAAARSDLAGHSIGPIGDAVTALLDAGKGQGQIRADADARDVILLLGFLTNLDDAMRTVTGITVEAGSIGGNHGNFYSRGYALDTIQVDGVNTPASTGNDLSSGFGLAIYDHIEVLRGPSGLYQGAGDPGGTVNLVRKRAPAKLANSNAATAFNLFAQLIAMELDAQAPTALSGVCGTRM